MKLLEISEVAKLSGVPASTLRYYESRNLISSVGRHGLRRLFEPVVLDALDTISLAKWAGFSLDEIAAWIGKDGAVRLDREQLGSRADEIDALASRLQVLAKMLRHTAHCPAPDHFECQTFRRMLRVARKSRLRESRKAGSGPRFASSDIPPVAGAMHGTNVRKTEAGEE